MIDWNGNGKLDPVDTGISIALIECDEQNDNTDTPCLTSPGNSSSESSFMSWLERMLLRK